MLKNQIILISAISFISFTFKCEENKINDVYKLGETFLCNNGKISKIKNDFRINTNKILINNKLISFDSFEIDTQNCYNIYKERKFTRENSCGFFSPSDTLIVNYFYLYINKNKQYIGVDLIYNAKKRKYAILNNDSLYILKWNNLD